MARAADGLERAVEAPEIVRALKPYGVTQSDIAAATGVTDRAVRGWQSSSIRPQRYDRLAELRDIVLVLSDGLTPVVSGNGCTPGTGCWAGVDPSSFSRTGTSRRFAGQRPRLPTAPTFDGPPPSPRSPGGG